jgi:hypothetical protein
MLISRRIVCRVEHGNHRARRPQGALFRIVSLLKMLQVNASVFVALMNELVMAQKLDLDEDARLPRDAKKLLRKILSNICGHCADMELDISAAQAMQMMAQVNLNNFGEIKQEIATLQTCVYRELERKLFFCIPASHERFFQDPALFGDKVDRKFKRVKKDVSEAGKCFSLGRYTACVLHLMRVMEVAVRAFADKLDIDLAGVKMWGKILEKIDDAIEAMPPSPAKSRYREWYIHLRNVKDVWRNETVHTQRTYGEDEAKEVLTSVDTFMRTIATQR